MTELNEIDYNRLYRYGIVLSKNEDDAWDILHHALSNYYSKDVIIENPISYIRSSMKNYYIDLKRHEISFAKTEYSQVDENDILSIDHRSLEDIIISKQEFDICWNVLNIDERELIYLSAIEQYTAQEIADEFGLSRGTILSKIYRIKSKVKSLTSNVVNFNKGGNHG